MAKLRFDPVTGKSEWEGTPQELLAVYDELKKRLGNTIQTENNEQSQSELRFRFIPNHLKFTPPCDYSELVQKMPTIDQLVRYILGKPKFEHDIVDISMKFFGKQIKSREYGKLYRQLRIRLENARKQIEVHEHGAFERRSGRPRNLKIYTFKRINAMPLGIQPEKTS
jgi:hypothetical protein